MDTVVSALTVTGTEVKIISSKGVFLSAPAHVVMGKSDTFIAPHSSEVTQDRPFFSFSLHGPTSPLS